MGFKLTASVVIGTDCTDSCKSNYHTKFILERFMTLRSSFTHNLLCCLNFCSFFYILQFTDVVLSTLIVVFCFALTINICILYIYLNIKLLTKSFISINQCSLTYNFLIKQVFSCHYLITKLKITIHIPINHLQQISLLMQLQIDAELT